MAESCPHFDKTLGMKEELSRRDFLDGVLFPAHYIDMGSENSGRTAGFATFDTVESFGNCELEISSIRDIAHLGVSGTYTWSRSGKVVSSVSLVGTGRLLAERHFKK